MDDERWKAPGGRRRRRPNNVIALAIGLLLAATVALVDVDAQSLANSFFAETGTHAGFVTRVSQRALDLLAEFLRERTLKFMAAGDVVFNVTTPLTNEVRLSMISVAVQQFDGPGFRSQLNTIPGKGLIWTGSNMSAVVGTQFRVSSVNGEIVGNAPLRIEKASVELVLWTGVNADGHLKTDLVTCKMGEQEKTVLSAYLEHIQRAVTDRLEEALCPTFHVELLPVISNRLMNTPLSAALFDHFFLNYAMLGPVHFNQSHILLRHRGNAFGILRQGRTRLNDFRLPFRAPPLLVDAAPSGKMIDFYLSNYTLSSLLFWMDQYRKFDYEISKTSVNNSAIAGYLRTECPSDDICAGTLFPALRSRFPSGVVVIKSHTVSFPRVRLEPGKALIFVDSRVDAFVQFESGERSRRFLTASMSAQLLMEQLVFKDYVLTGKLKIDKFTMGEVASLVDGIDQTSLEFLVNALNDLILADDMVDKLKSGISLPIMFDFEQKDAEVVVEKDRIRVSVDFCFAERCQPNLKMALAENKDTNIDYYDVVKEDLT